MLESEHEQFRRDAGIQGIQVPDMHENEETEDEQPTSSLRQQVARRRAEKQGKDPEKAAEGSKFGAGIGYTLIGG